MRRPRAEKQNKRPKPQAPAYRFHKSNAFACCGAKVKTAEHTGPAGRGASAKSLIQSIRQKESPHMSHIPSLDII